MPALLFPNLTALRLALASGLVPAEYTHSPTAAGFDAHGRLGIQLPELPPRESLAALARIGVQALGGGGWSTEKVRCWAELLPLVSSPTNSDGLVLFVVPDKGIARFVGRLRRFVTTPLGIALREYEGEQHGWVTALNPPVPIVADVDEPGASVEAFAEQIPGVWVRRGWRHPLPGHVVRTPGQLLLLRPPRVVEAVTGDIPTPEADDYQLPHVPGRSRPAVSRVPVVPVRLRLAPRHSSQKESLWVLNSAAAAEFWRFCASADERLTRRLEAGSVTCGSETRLVVRVAGKRGSVVLPPPFTGYVEDSRVPGLFVPADRVLRPALRARELAHALGLGPNRLVWIEAGHDGGVVPHAVAMGVLRRVAELIEYTAPPPVALATRPRTDLFTLPRLPVVRSDVIPLPELDLDLEPPAPREAEAKHARRGRENAEHEPGWFRRSLHKLVARLRPRREPPAAQPHAEEPQPHPTPTAARAERTLASPDALLHGHDWTARRRELESRLFRELPNLNPDERAGRWADLAVVYATTGNPADAAVCWMNAVWESPSPPPAWLEQWFTAECRAAKLTDQSGGLDRWLCEPGRPGVGRVLAAYTARAGFATNPPSEFPGALRHILAFLDQHFDDLPLRATWLARLAATRLCDGDALGLARWRDRVLARLAERGPGLDLDEPSFLRFHGTVSADRFHTAREWLKSVHDPALKWVRAHGGGRLRWPGLDPETECTPAYAQFMLAWGLGCLGERTLAKDWAARARKQLRGNAGPGVDPAVPALLGDLFLYRVKDAQEGRQPKPGLPPEFRERIDQLPAEANLARYSVNRLRKHSRILEPLDRVQAFGGLDMKVFWGTDRLGERLFVLADRADPSHLVDEAEALLRLCAETPGTATVPRVVLTLLEVAPWLDAPTVLRLLDLLPTAIEWVEAWLAAGRWTGEERPDRLARYQAQLVEAGCTAAGALLPGVVGPTMEQLVRRLLSAGAAIRQPLLAVAGPLFRCLRRLGMRSEAETLMRFLDPGELGAVANSRLAPTTRLGLAVGWLTAGNDDTGNRVLNEARERLYLAGDQDVRARTELAIAYADALGFAPPRIAYGRLEELFQRLGRVEVKGSTNRYFTLKPLQLIDTVIRSVVTDEFTLGPAVRGWLDDDEFLIRGRVHRDMAAVLREQGLG
jgi:hypothetical protein